MVSRLLILHDSPDFGGHELMALALLPGVVEAGAYERITFAFSAGNVRLDAALAETLPSIHRVRWPFVKRRGEPYLRAARWGYRTAVRRLIVQERAETVLLVQGRIENGATAMLAVPRTVRLVSYVPMAHRLSDMGRVGFVGDRVRRALYRRPDAFIVPAPSVVRQLAAAGAVSPVTVAANSVAPAPRTEREVARRSLELDPSLRIALVLGRLDAAQKGLDRLAAAVRRMRDGGRWTIVVVGDGPAREQMTALADEQGGKVVVVPWTDRPDLYLSAADALLMPSRWEGLPLVALEAMTYRVPVLASSLDVFADMLPADHLFDWDGDDLADALERITTPAALARFAEHSRAYLAPLDLASARRAFLSGLTGGSMA